jgi:hypothetical protein
MFDRARRIWDVVRTQREEKLKQANLAAVISTPAPAHQLRLAFTALAGTRVTDYRRFMDEVRLYRRKLIDGFQRRGLFGRNALRFFTRRPEEEIKDDLREQRLQEYRKDREAFWRKVSNFEEWERLSPDWIPPFTFSGGEPDFDKALWPVSFLAVVTALVFLIGFFTFLHYDVR